MSGSGRPLRFLVSLLALWVGMRVFQLWPVDGTMLMAERLRPAAAVEPAGQTGKVPDQPAFPARHSVALSRRDGAVAGAGTEARKAQRPWPTSGAASGLSGTPPAAQAPHRPGDALNVEAGSWSASTAFTSQAGLPAEIPGAPLAAPSAGSRLRGSGWLIVRGGETAPFVPQLGGSQAGVRLTYALDQAARLAVAGRFSTALGGRQREAAIGLDWQPTRLPVHVFAEQRIGIEQARGGPSVGLIGGFGPTSIAGPIMLDGYAQAGVIARRGAEGFADGALRLSRTVAQVGAARLELGIGAWGGAQRGAARLDAGPMASAVLPVATASLRLSLEWRERLAGQAAPASGPALSIGTDF